MKQDDIICEIDRLSKKIALNKSYGPMSIGVFYAPYIPGYTKTTFALKKLMPKYQFSRKWFIADFDTTYYGEVEAWCKEQFGPHPKYPDAWSRWVHTYEDQIHFRDQKDYNWFVMRWGA